MQLKKTYKTSEWFLYKFKVDLDVIRWALLRSSVIYWCRFHETNCGRHILFYANVGSDTIWRNCFYFNVLFISKNFSKFSQFRALRCITTNFNILFNSASISSDWVNSSNSSYFLYYKSSQPFINPFSHTKNCILIDKFAIAMSFCHRQTFMTLSTFCLHTFSMIKWHRKVYV